MLINDRYHLTYCTNIHSEKNLESLLTGLQNLLPEIKKRISPEKDFGIGLRLSDHSTRELLEGKNLNLLKEWLSEHHMYVFTLNGFPYGNFHQKKVKDDVHKPDWTTRERVEYTKRLCRILSVLLPKDIEGGISTSPISYKPWFLDSPSQKSKVLKKGAEHLASVVEELIRIKKESGKTIHIDIEPEPDGMIEDTEETISFFKNYLIPEGIVYLKNKTSLSESEIETALYNHVRICYDLCHFALQYEHHEDSLRMFKKAGIRIGKVQLSSAVKLDFDKPEAEIKEAIEDLKRLDEPRYLHQVIQLNKDFTISQYNDLDLALKNLNFKNISEWRVHFHVPLFEEKFGSLDTTRPDVENFLNLIRNNNEISQLEVETYTWEVMPGEYRLDLSDSICNEMSWVKSGLLKKEVVR